MITASWMVTEPDKKTSELNQCWTRLALPVSIRTWTPSGLALPDFRYDRMTIVYWMLPGLKNETRFPYRCWTPLVIPALTSAWTPLVLPFLTGALVTPLAGSLYLLFSLHICLSHSSSPRSHPSPPPPTPYHDPFLLQCFYIWSLSLTECTLVIRSGKWGGGGGGVVCLYVCLCVCLSRAVWQN